MTKEYLVNFHYNAWPARLETVGILFGAVVAKRCRQVKLTDFSVAWIFSSRPIVRSTVNELRLVTVIRCQFHTHITMSMVMVTKATGEHVSYFLTSQILCRKTAHS